MHILKYVVPYIAGKFGGNKKNGYELILAKFKLGAVAICARMWVLRITSWPCWEDR